MRRYALEEFSSDTIEKLNNTTIAQLAMQLEDGLINMATLPEDMSVAEFIQYYLY